MSSDMGNILAQASARYGTPVSGILAAGMDAALGKLMTSPNDHPDMRRIFADRAMLPVDVHDEVGKRSGHAQAAREFEIANWESGTLTGGLFYARLTTIQRNRRGLTAPYNVGLLHSNERVCLMPNRYAAERGIPTVPACRKSNIQLRFDGRFLFMIGPAGRAYAAVSGRPTSSGGFDYSPARQRESREGPIPPGRYWIQPSQMWTNHWYNVAPRAAWGDHRITIHVFPGTETYGRGGFFLHGGTHPGSAGCINLHGRMENLVRDLQTATVASPDCYILLTVEY
ncbi:tlde1 domain-containing protein [Paraburkholderia caffeinilytica]|uniref:tlde1 domain-containing protein n=1 Tax=Paraburkholderia caffeinilytica TaxID=1761016 RepID=UPI003D9FFA78